MPHGDTTPHHPPGNETLGAVYERLYRGELRARLDFECSLRDGSTTTHGGEFPHELITAVAAERYFALVRRELAGMENVFTEDEVLMLMMSCPAFAWPLTVEPSLQRSVTELSRLGHSCDDTDLSVQLANAMAAKLARLSAGQQLALIDLCERYTRTRWDPELSFGERIDGLGLGCVGLNDGP